MYFDSETPCEFCKKRISFAPNFKICPRGQWHTGKMSKLLQPCSSSYSYKKNTFTLQSMQQANNLAQGVGLTISL